MFTTTPIKGGWVLVVEQHVCIKCKRMIVTNDEPHYKGFHKDWKGWAFAHKVCPPNKPQEVPYEQLQQ